MTLATKQLDGVVQLYAKDGDQFKFCGTAFSLLNKRVFVTANHCLVDKVELYIVPASRPLLKKVLHITRHEKADLALLYTGTRENDPVTPFRYFGDPFSIGDEFTAYGFPEDSIYNGSQGQSARLFKGHAQRLIHSYASLSFPGRYTYQAIEMNIPCPLGLSGGPLYVETHHGLKVIGLAAENIEAGTVLKETEIIDDSTGDTTYLEIRRQVEYGIAVYFTRDICRWILDCGKKVELA